VSLVVVKAGGAALEAAARAIAELVSAGHSVCVVHGAGPQITAEMKRRGLPVEFAAGRRVTSAAALDVARESCVAVNAALCDAVGPAAVAFPDGVLEAQPIPELGLVGDPVPSAPPAVLDALAAGRVPVVAPLALGPLNVNGDEAASALAVGLGADRLVFVTDVPGVFVEGVVATAIAADDAQRLVDAGEFAGGIVPKLLAAARAARLGVTAEIGETAVTA
jgi:acetylglutamate kinase